MPEKFTEVFHKQSPLLQSEKQGESSLQKHIYYLENISPYDLLKDKTGGKEPLKKRSSSCRICFNNVTIRARSCQCFNRNNTSKV